MDKKKIIVLSAGLVVVMYGVTTLLSTSDEPYGTTSGEKSQTGIAAKLRRGFKDILPGSQKPQTHSEDDPHVVVIKSEPNQMDAADVTEKLEFLKGKPDHEALVFARWAVFNENTYSVSEREQFLDKAMEVLPLNEKKMILRDVIFVGKFPELYEGAFGALAQSMSKDELENLVREVSQRKPGSQAETAALQFAASKNLNVR